MQLDIPKIGSVLFIGYESQWQSNVIRDLAGQHLASGGSVVSLHDYASDGQAATTAMSDWLRVKGVNRCALDRFSVIEQVRQHTTSEELQTAIERKPSRTKHKPVLILRDLACESLQVLPGVSWLGVADEIALLMDCLVLTAGHYGPEPLPPQDPLKYRADQVWTCRAGNDLKLTLQRHKPTDATAQLKGKVQPFGVIAFENTHDVEFAR